MLPGLSASFNITFVAREGGNWTNVVVAKSNLTENKSADNITFVEGPGMDIIKLTLNKTVIVGDDVYFMIVVTNTGNCDLHGVNVTEMYNSSELRYANHNKQNLWVKTGDVFAYQDVLAKGESANFTIWFKTLVKGNITNTVNATSKEAENISAHNNTTTVYKPDMAVSKLSLNSSVIVGSDVYFMIVVKNTGDCDLSGIKVTEIFNSTELNYVNHSKRDLWVRNGDVFAYQGVLARGESANFTVWFTTLVNCTVLNTVNASSTLLLLLILVIVI